MRGAPERCVPALGHTYPRTESYSLAGSLLEGKKPPSRVGAE